VLRKCIATSIVNISKLRVVSRGKTGAGVSPFANATATGNKQRVAD